MRPPAENTDIIVHNNNTTNRNRNNKNINNNNVKTHQTTTVGRERWYNRQVPGEEASEHWENPPSWAVTVLQQDSRCGQTTVNKKAPIHYIISINDKVYRPL